MPVLTSLPGTKEDKEVHFIDIPRRAVKFLLKGCAVTAVGENGAINVWSDDEGQYRCCSMRYYQTQDNKIFDDIQNIIPWLKIWLEKIQ